MKIEYKNYLIEEEKRCFCVSVLGISKPIKKKDWSIAEATYWVRDQKFAYNLEWALELVLDFERKEHIKNVELENIVTELKNLNTRVLIELKNLINEWWIKE